MPKDREYIRRAAAALDDIMAKPFEPTHGIRQENISKRNRPIVVETKRKRKLPMRTGVADKGD